MTAALQMQGVRKSFGPTEIIRGIDLEIPTGERHAIIGPNGAGKSTLFHLISGKYSKTAGRILLNGTEVTELQPYQINRMGLSRSFQITNIFPRLSVFENVRCGLLWSMGYRNSFWRLVDTERALNERAAQILDEIGLLERCDLPAGVLAYAEQRALEIGITIAGGAEVIMLDEPTAGMSHSETEGVVELIRRVTQGRTLVMVEHDMGVIFNLADRISVLVYGEIIATGTPEEVRASKAVQEAYLGAVDAGEGEAH
ncbi:ABC transporter ATP-binding protein [Thalassobaculum salexigens]|uniref:ABC transporter ATP-binding protein n=1 Tax=Thalassobaculum salexigens TaxID=455360 RepID=UPI00248E78D2|nr:ABC transporter ATP-binding protein [Thalassobaculum salexigens]